jgi:hypothetical protein
VKHYFEFQHILDGQRVTLATFHLEGKANQHIELKGKKLQGFIIIFEHEVVVRFGPNEYEDYDESLFGVQQHGSLHDYQAKFEKLANRVKGWSQRCL